VIVPKRALVSVADKGGLVGFTRRLAGVEFLSTGGTAKALREGGMSVTDVAEYTDSPEVLGGRVKTLHPRVHGGILSRRTAEDAADLKRLGGAEIDLVIVNLYPFQKTVAAGAGLAEAIEQIDIGGVALLRAAAKNFAHVITLCDPADYDRVADAIETGGISEELNRELATKAFAHTAAYDAAITAYLSPDDALPPLFFGGYKKERMLRYGENPHQSAALYLDLSRNGGIAAAKPLAGKELSFNNYWDLAAAWAMVADFDRPTVAIIKHTNPCGLASADTLERAYELALAGDPMSAFGSIIALNRPVDAATAERLHKTKFVECVAAPSYEDGTLERMTKKKNRRFMALGEAIPEVGFDGRFIPGGLLLQQSDSQFATELEVASQRKPDTEEKNLLNFAWRACKHVKSNAIVLAKGEEDGSHWLVGVGAGQMSRVDSAEIAVRKAGDRAVDSVAASDAFFPMADGVEALAEAGVKAIIQPGGSKGDPAVIAAVDKAGQAMFFTKTRHFKH